MVDLNVFSWNVRGLNSPIKRTRCLQFMHHNNVDIALIQESHLKQEDVHRFQNRRFKIIASSCASNKTKGVVILVKRSAQLTVHLTGKDTSGRFAYAIVSVSGRKILFASIYSPNDFDVDFLNGISNTLLSFVDCSLFIGGDLNATVNPFLDRSPASNCFPPSTVALNHFITELNLTDVWRIKNPSTKAYSFYSARHKSLSRIDYILVGSSLLDQICEVDILPRLISDHSPLQCRIKPSAMPPKFRRWRFNDSLLFNKVFIENLQTQLQEFLSFNQTESCNPQILWETTKCFLRGFCIAFSSKLKKQSAQRMSQLESEIKTLEKQQSESYSENVDISLSALRSEYNRHSSSKAAFIVHRTRQKYYYQGDRPSHLLALRLKENESKSCIDIIRTAEGAITTDPIAINNTFKSFYTNLYSSQSTLDKKLCKTFLNNLQLPTLDDSDRASLEKSITLDELHEAARSLQRGKSPGMDGIPPELYLAVWDIVGPLMLDSINFAIKGGSFHRDQKLAIITLLLKKDKDPLDCSSFRPISLICADVKIFAKALVTRIEPLVNKLVHHDQTGFIKGRMASDNLRRLLHVIDLVDSSQEPTAVFSLDAFKAFDRLRWDYLWVLLEHYGFGTTFIGMVKALYCSPTASVLTGFCKSQPFELQRGTRQGCPLSPLLFALSLEPLAQAVRQSQSISPITLLGTSHHISLFADDTLLYLSNINKTVPHVLQLFDKFHDLSGYKINWAKSSLMQIGPSKVKLSLPPFIPIVTSFTYLGIKISGSLSNILRDNYYDLTQKITADLQRWSSLKISMQARVTILKMNILPRFNFLFFMLPMQPPPDFFKSTHSQFSQFIWAGKRARIRLSTLQRPKEEGGLALPDLKLYFLAFHIRSIHVWMDPKSNIPWRPIEAKLTYPNQLTDIPFMKIGRKSTLRYGTIISSTLRAWHNAERILGGPFKLTLSSPLWNNPCLTSGKQPFTSHIWSSKGIHTVNDICDNGTLRTFQDLQHQYDLPGSSYFLYLQLRSSMKAYGVPWHSLFIRSHPLSNLICPSNLSRGLVTKLYNLMMSNSLKPLSVVSIWDRELEAMGIVPDWEEIWDNLPLTSKCLAHQLIHYKMIHKAYTTPYIRFKMNISQSPQCMLCQNATGTFLHMFWECPIISIFWKYVIEMLSKFLDTTLVLDPCFCLLNDDSSLDLSLREKRLVFAGFTAAKKTIFQLWFKPDISAKCYWIRSLLDIASLEETTARLNNASLSTVNAWKDLCSRIKDILS